MTNSSSSGWRVGASLSFPLTMAVLTLGLAMYLALWTTPRHVRRGPGVVTILNDVLEVPAL
jgi:hypothetical protein